jgi:serine/threonine-protein kinase
MTETSTTEPGAKAELDLAPGTVVGEYQVESKLGQGGFGAVFKAQHPLIGKVVAIKVLAPKFSADPEMVQRFIAEARAVNQIRHRNIIDIFSFGQLPDGRHYYVMEYLEGETLDRLIDREHVLAPEVALPILRAIARALDAAHAKGIAHRDLKPENVFLAKDGDDYFPKLLDFGIAKLLAADDGNKVKTRTGIPIGTPYYMSPEQCRGKDVDHRTDYYAFGVVAYQMLTGTYPIDADDYMSILMMQISEEPRPPSQVNPRLPAGIDDGIAWLMRKDPAERPPNLVTAVRALEGAAAAGGIAVDGWDSKTPTPHTLERPPTPPTRASKTPGAFAATAAARTPGGFAETIPSGAAPAPVAPTRRGMLRWLVGGFSAAALAGGAAFVLTSQGTREPQRAPVPLAASVPPPKADAMVVAPPPPPVADAAVVEASVAITIEHAPAGSEVLRGDEVLGVVPGPFQLERGGLAVQLVVRHTGYVPAKLSVVPDQARTLDATLVPVRKRPPVSSGKTPKNPATDPHSIEDPFTRK